MNWIIHEFVVTSNCNFILGRFALEYDDFIRGLGVGHENQSLGITPKNFQIHKFFTIFGISLKFLILYLILQYLNEKVLNGLQQKIIV